jgi:Flp pilus assembly protein TadD
MSGDLVGAINDFTQAIGIDPKYGEAYLNRGIVKEMLRDMKGACTDWKKASELGVAAAENYVNNQCQ